MLKPFAVCSCNGPRTSVGPKPLVDIVRWVRWVCRVRKAKQVRWLRVMLLTLARSATLRCAN